MAINPAACFFVICRADDDEDGVYVLATRETFPTRIAANVYAAATVSPSREPIIVEAPRGLTREAERESVSAQRLANALAVFVLDAKLYNYLKANDPKALEQAINAINGYDPKLIEGKLSGPSFPVPHVFVPTEPGSDTCGVCGKYKRYVKFHPDSVPYAYVQLRGSAPGKRIGIVKYNDGTGYYPAPAGTDDPLWSDETVCAKVCEMNSELGMSCAVSEAFEAGSMFGWHVPAAKPAHEFINGK